MKPVDETFLTDWALRYCDWEVVLSDSELGLPVLLYVCKNTIGFPENDEGKLTDTFTLAVPEELSTCPHSSFMLFMMK